MCAYHMPIPERILVFGAAGHIGKALAHHVASTTPEVRLRLVTSKHDQQQGLLAEFPGAEVLCASYFDRESIETALSGVEGAFVVTPSFLDEKTAMANFIAAVEKSSTLQQFIRIVGDPPGMRLERVPQVLKDFGGGTAIQHLIARDLIERSGLPATFLNITNSFMDNFLRFAPQIRAGQWIAPSDRLIGYIDPAEIGEAAARILLSQDSRHILQHYNVDNGEKPLRNSAVVALMNEVLGYPIELLISQERFAEIAGPLLNSRYGHSRGAEYMIEYMQFEEANELTWRQTDFLETILCRKPLTLRQWLELNRSAFDG